MYFYYEPNCIATIKLLLRRTLQRFVRYCALCRHTSYSLTSLISLMIMSDILVIEFRDKIIQQ